MTAEINVKVIVTNAMCGDIAVTAAEGGIGYWSQIDSYQWTRWVDQDTMASAEVADDFVFYTIRPDLDDSGTYKGDPVDITPTLIQRGIDLFLNGKPNDGKFNFQPRPFEDMEDIAAMDADEADCVIQLGAFSELVYG